MKTHQRRDSFQCYELRGVRGGLSLALLLFKMAFFSGSSAFAAGVVLETNGFESYANGPLRGQFGWVSTLGLTSTANVQGTIVHSGAKAVRVDKAANSDARWAVVQNNLPTARYIRVSWNMRVERSTSSTELFGPFFGSEAYDATAGEKVVGSFGVDASTGDVLYQESVTGELTETGTRVTLGAWNSFDLQLDYQTQSYRGFLNNSPLFTESFVDRGPSGGPLTQFTDADISAIAAGADAGSRALAGVAYFDNFRVYDVKAADFDVDLDVDSDDFMAWASAFGTTSLMGDATRDGRAAGDDFLAWQRDVGVNLAASSASLNAVPEPAAGFWMVTIGCLFSRRRCPG